jgi:AraC-like DNA-binding protein
VVVEAPDMAGLKYSPFDEDRPVSETLFSTKLITDYNFKTSSVEHFEDILRSAITDHKLSPSSRGAHFNGDFGFNGWSDLCIFHMSFGRELAADLVPEDPNDRMGFAWAIRGKNELVLKGKRYPAFGSHGVTFNSGPPRTILFSEDADISGVMMSRRRLADYCSKMLGYEIDGFVEFETQFHLDTSGGQSWQRLVDYAAAELSNPLSLVRRIPAARQQLEQMVMTGFLLAQTHNHSGALLRPQSPAAPYYVRRAEAYIEAHYAEPLSLADIAAQAGVSARSLQNGFQNFRNMTPMAFLRRVRLEHAHRSLLAADPAFATVTDIAIGSGFSHMGEFAALYRRTFGETPRETLLRKVRG